MDEGLSGEGERLGLRGDGVREDVRVIVVCHDDRQIMALNRVIDVVIMRN